jgi:nitrite reductase/ring-hydroxylating ferredoxin subunit/AcrR family transcriptional regulator
VASLVHALGAPLVVWRTRSGRISVLSNVCVHRGGSLFSGKITGEDITCPYHGWAYRTDGVCSRIPAQPDRPIPPRARVDSYPADERYGIVWGFLGDLPEAERPAGISPGSLYQFFDDKGHIARVLGERYAAEVTALHRSALSEVDDRTALPEVLDRILDPIVAFKNSHTAFLALFARPDLPESLLGPVAVVDRAFAGRVASILHIRNPDRSTTELRTVADTMISLFRGVVGSLGSASGDPDADLAEVKLMLLGYLQLKGLR